MGRQVIKETGEVLEGGRSSSNPKIMLIGGCLLSAHKASSGSGGTVSQTLKVRDSELPRGTTPSPVPSGRVVTSLPKHREESSMRLSSCIFPQEVSEENSPMQTSAGAEAQPRCLLAPGLPGIACTLSCLPSTSHPEAGDVR